MRSTTFFVAALAIVAGRVAAQDPTTTDSADGADATDGATDGTTDPTDCVMNCAMTSMTTGGCEMTDLTCLCTSEAYMAAVQQCVTSTCGEEGLAAAAEYQTEMCASVDQPTESISASASSAIAAATSSIAAGASSAASSVHASASSAARSSASVVSASATASSSASGNAGTALKMPSISYLGLGATALGFVVGPLLLFA
ncbi:hypothetical protein FRC01_011625 [Tulasnella sp. 417]|nr:hypothetical protein FRC01_011625 [Tulasnella sp. 417]